MKKIFCFALLATFIVACKKEGGSSKKLYLGKVFTNDLLSEEYIYTADKKAIRKNVYSTALGQSVFAGFRIYEYENGLVGRVLRYNKEGALSDKRLYSYDASHKLTRVDMFGNDENLDAYYMYQYENQQLSKIVSYSAPPTKKTGEWQLSYNAQENFVSIKRYYISLNSLVLFDSAHCTNTDKMIPPQLFADPGFMLDFPIENTLIFMPVSSMYYYMPGGPPSKSTATFSEKTYNGRGYLTSQKYKLDADNGLGITTYNYNLKYEYVE